jgi:protein disulfide-isomerase
MSRGLHVILLLVLFGLLTGSAQAGPGWSTDLPEALAKAKAERKFVLLHFGGSDWCGWCIQVQKEVYSKRAFKSYAQSNLVLVQIDFPKRKPQPTAVRKANRTLARKFQVEAFPTLILLDAGGKELGRLGYGRGGPRAFIAEIKKVIHPQPEPSQATRRVTQARPSTPGKQVSARTATRSKKPSRPTRLGLASPSR